MKNRIIEDVNIKCDKCGKSITFKVYYNKDKETLNIYNKANLDDVEVCGCVGACKQYVNKYNDMPLEIIR